MCRYDSLFSNERLLKSSIERPNRIDDFYSDRSRIIYCSSFRRLQQKAQVFSLEPNSNVRTRLTHSLEVSDLGKTLANKIGFGLKKKGLISHGKIPELVAIVENACLAHDIGNPPFGHFGEDAIREWARRAINDDLLKKAEIFRPGTNEIDFKVKNLSKDFEEFDGNPQGFRIISKLHCERDEYSLNLTLSTLLCALKYVRTTGEEVNKKIGKKPGYFQTEEKLVDKLWCKLERKPHTRFPFAYIVEAVDDIAYCLSDIADGIEKNIIQPDDFLGELRKVWDTDYRGEKCPVNIPEKATKEHFALDVSVPWSRELIDYACKSFLDEADKYMEGNEDCLIPENSPHGKFIETIKTVSKRLLYSSEAAESIELAGYSVISGILNKFQCLLELPYEEFKKILDGATKGHPFELRIFHRIGKKYIKRYKRDVESLDENDENFSAYEWWYRAHMVIDHVSGMTDAYALTTYQILHGIKL